MLCVGATGSVGQLVVEEGRGQGYTVRALVRDRATAPKWAADVEISEGDLTRSESFRGAVAGVDAVVFVHGTYGGDQGTAESVDYGAVRNVLGLVGRHARIALMTAIAVTDRRGVHDWKRRAERLVRASGLAYTIVRPGWFDENAPEQHRLVLLQGDRRQSGTPRDGVIDRRQLAEVLVHSLRAPHAVSKTFELVAERGDGPRDFDALFATTDPDVDRALDGAHDAHNMPLDGEPPRIVEDVERALRGRSQ
nr:SDR family oxidoreductase [Kofleriaceae bacterium]